MSTLESRRRCGRSPGCGRASPGADEHCRVPAKMWVSPGVDVGPAMGRQAVSNPGADADTHPSVYPPRQPMHARSRAPASARALAWGSFYSCTELASLLSLGVCEYVKKAVHACPEVHLCVRVWALGRPRVHMCVRACSQGDGRGAGRSRTAWETGLRSVGYPGSYGPTYVLRPVRCCCGRALAS